MVLARIRRFFAPPRFADDEKTRKARLLNFFLWVNLCAVLANVLGNRLSATIPIESDVINVVFAALMLGLRALLHRGCVYLATYAVLTLMVVAVVSIVVAEGAPSSSSASFYAIVVALSLLTSRPVTVVGTALCSLILLGIVLAQQRGIIASSGQTVTLTDWATHTILMIWVAFFVQLTVHDLLKAGARARQEVAERRKAETTLRLMLQQMNVILWSTDTELRFTAGRGGGLASLNLQPDQLVGMPVADFFETAEQAAPTIAVIRRALQGESVTYEQLWRGATYQSCVEPLRDESGQIVGTVALSLDISERKRVEMALRESEEKFRTVFDLAPYAITISRTDDTFVEANQALLDRLGMTSDQVVGTKVLPMLQIDPDIVAMVAEHINTTGQIHNVEIKVCWPDGSYGYTLTSVKRISLAGEPHMLSVSADITALKQAHAAREQLITELEARNAELERFTYTVSHDLKSPLVTIRGFLGFLEKDALEGNMERLREDIGRIKRATDKMQRLLNDLLELSRIGRVMNPPQAVPLATIVHEALELVAGRLSAGNISVRVSDELPIVYGDRKRLVEVMQNLVDNAARFMGAQPAPCIEIGVRAEGGEQVCYVRDNGIGIAAQYHQKIFGLFEKLDPQSEGTGIGLALVKRIVEGHGGRIWVESAGEGHGATFCLTLPPPPAS